jgi:hypothetical protein
MRRALCAALFFLVGFNPALGEVRIEASTGGEVKTTLPNVRVKCGTTVTLFNQLLLDAFAAYPQHLISTEVLLWFVHDPDSDDYKTSLRAFNNLPVGAELPWNEFQAINRRRSVRSLQRNGLVKCWGRLQHIYTLNGRYQKHVCAHAVRAALMDRTDLDVDGLEAAEGSRGSPAPARR